MSREAVRVLQERRKGHEDAIEVIDAALKELGASGVRRSRATRRGSNGGGDRMKAAHAALAAKRAAKKASTRPTTIRERLQARHKPAGASLAEAVEG